MKLPKLFSELICPIDDYAKAMEKAEAEAEGTKNAAIHYCFSCNPLQPSGSAVVTLRTIDSLIELVEESIDLVFLRSYQSN